MTDTTTALYRPAQVAEMDRYAIQELGVPGLRLMERAGAYAYQVLREHWPDRRNLVIVCGAGNNGGDGYVMAEMARRDGLRVEVLQLVPTEQLRGDAATVARRYQGAGGVCRPFEGQLPQGADVVVDALLGTGLDRPVEGRWAEAIDCINGSGLPVLAVDIPSGLSGDTGAVMGVGIQAHLTVTFIGRKRGLYTGAGPRLVGEILYHDLDVPPEVHAHQTPAAQRVRHALLGSSLPRRPRDGHKGLYGHVLVVGGDRGMGGAALMAGRAALRTGAGLVSVATHPAHAPALLAAQPELMIRGVESVVDLTPMLQRASVAVLGPGLGQAGWGRALYQAVLDAGLPCLLDADALNLMADAPVGCREDWVLTPHPGEAARLLGSRTPEVQADRFSAMEQLLARYGGACVLKGAGSLIGASGQVTRVCDEGNPGMATGGTGDVLSGVIGGLMAQGYAPFEAAELGACLHAAAGDLAARDGERGMAATDLIPFLRQLINP